MQKKQRTLFISQRNLKQKVLKQCSRYIFFLLIRNRLLNKVRDILWAHYIFVLNFEENPNRVLSMVFPAIENFQICSEKIVFQSPYGQECCIGISNWSVKCCTVSWLFIFVAKNYIRHKIQGGIFFWKSFKLVANAYELSSKFLQ